MKLRISRLWPTIAIGMGIASILIFTVSPTDVALKALVLNLLMIPASCEGKALYCFNGPAWSLACEFVANLVHVWILWRLSDRALLIASLTAGIMLALVVLQYNSADIGVRFDNFWGGYLRCAFGYTLGIWMARKWRVAPNLQLPWWLGLTPAIAVPFLVQQVNADAGIVDAFACLILLPGCFWLATQAKVPASIRPVLDWLGRRSYPIYAVNHPIKSLTLYLGLSLGLSKGFTMMALVIVFSLIATELILLAGLGGQKPVSREKLGEAVVA